MSARKSRQPLDHFPRRINFLLPGLGSYAWREALSLLHDEFQVEVNPP